VINDAECVELMDAAARRLVGEHAVVEVEQSLGGLSQALGAAATHYAEAELANARLFLR
jgi:hypothetical protein